MIATRATTRDGAILRAARDLAQLLAFARQHLTAQRARICPSCHHIFSPDRRLDMRCPACARDSEAHDA
jgi:rubrerythrin